MRKISFKLLTQVQLETIESDVRTVGELTQLIQNGPLNEKINLGQVKFIDKASFAEFGSIPEAVLPSTDCILFVTPMKTKSGVDITAENFTQFDDEDVIDFVNEMGYLEVRSFGSILNRIHAANIDLQGKRDDIVPRVIDYVEDVFLDMLLEDNEETFTVELTNKEMLLEAIELIEAVIINMKDSEDVAVSTTYTELQQQAERLRDLLNK